MNKTPQFLIIILLYSTCLFAVERGKTADGDAPKKEPVELKLVDFSPKTLQKKFEASSLAIFGEVVSIVPLKEEEVEGSRRKISARREYAARVKILDVYKGGYPEDELTVVFLRSDKIEKEPLMDLEEGERTILFLNPGENPPYFALVENHYGKEAYTDSNDESLKKMGADSAEDPAKVTINLSVKKESAGDETSVFATILIMNNTKKPARIDSLITPHKVLSISDSAGSPVHAVSGSMAASPEMIVLKPQHFIGARYDLKQHFDLTKPGSYNIRASMLEPNWKAGGAPEMIYSKTIVFQID